MKNVRQFVKVFFVVTIFCFSVSSSISAYETEINSLSASMAEKIVAANKTKVAVVDFTDLQGDVTELGRFIAEEFSVALAGMGKGFKVVDRTHLKSIIKEHKLSATGLIDPETARKLGKIAGVEALVTGTLTPFGDSVRIAVKILDTTTAEIIDAKSGNIAKTQAIDELLGRMASKEMDSSDSSKTEKEIADKKDNGNDRIKVEKGFTFELQGCKKSGKCDFLITSNDQDKEISVRASYEGSRLFDNVGNEYSAKEVKVGNNSHHTYVAKILPADIVTKASLDFGNITNQATLIKLLEIKANGIKIKFHDVPISQ